MNIKKKKKKSNFVKYEQKMQNTIRENFQQKVHSKMSEAILGKKYQNIPKKHFRGKKNTTQHINPLETVRQTDRRTDRRTD